MYQDLPSDWVRRFVPLIRRGGRVLDLAAGGGRHTRLLLDMGFAVTAVDRDVSQLQQFAGVRCAVPELDLEAGDPAAAMAPLGSGYNGIVVTNYLHRPLFPGLAAALAPAGVLIYQTFAAGNERLGWPRNPDFLLRPGELLDAFAGLTLVAFEQGEVETPRPAVIQRLAAIAGPLGNLPESAG
jgi:SAM-dependent methyltransferase